MPNVQLRIVEEGMRSSLYVSPTGELYRWYNDTDRWEGPLHTFMDASGNRRYGANRKVSQLVDEAFNPIFRGSQTQIKKKKCPEHMQHACRQLLKHLANIHDFAASCNVSETTAWNYACGVVERWPLTHPMARAFVHPPLLEALSKVDCTGSLVKVLERLNDGPLHYDAEWRHMDATRFSHLRLARLCLNAAEVELQRNQASSVAS